MKITAGSLRSPSLRSPKLAPSALSKKIIHVAPPNREPARRLLLGECLSFISPFVSPAKEKPKDKNPEEMNRLRDQLVGTFKEQMDIRLDKDVAMFCMFLIVMVKHNFHERFVSRGIIVSFLRVIQLNVNNSTRGGGGEGGKNV